MLNQVRQRQLRRSTRLVHVSVKDQYGQLCQGTVLIVSDNQVALFAESPPRSDLVEIQPANSNLWISMKTEHCISVSSGYIVRCAFASPATPDILQALHRAR